MNSLRWSSPVAKALLGAIVLLILWRVLATGAAALLETGTTLPAVLDDKSQESIWRDRIAQDPTDVEALLVLGRELQRTGKRQEAEATLRLGLQLAPADRRALLEAAG